MRCAVLVFGGRRKQKVLAIAQSLVRGIEEQGHDAQILDVDTDTGFRLTGYQYIAVGTSPISPFGGKIETRIAEVLGASGHISGKKAFAFVPRGGFGTQKALLRLMNRLEHEGVFVRFSDVIRSPAEAAIIGRRLKIDQ